MEKALIIESFFYGLHIMIKNVNSSSIKKVKIERKVSNLEAMLFSRAVAGVTQNLHKEIIKNFLFIRIKYRGQHT